MPTISNIIGDEAEERIKDALFGKRVPQSGGGHFFKLDVRDDEFVVSVKATKNGVIKLTADLWREAKRAARGPRGAGSGVKPAFVGDIDGDAIICLRLEDWLAVATGASEPHITPSKGATRRARLKASKTRRSG